MAMGGLQKVPISLQIEELGRFAVNEYNKTHHAHLEFKKVTNAEVQVVAGEMYYLTLEAAVTVHGHKHNKYYEAKVWVKPWMDFKKLEEFKPLLDA